MSDALFSIGAGGLLYALGALLVRDRHKRDCGVAGGIITFGVSFFAWLAIRLFYSGGGR